MITIIYHKVKKILQESKVIYTCWMHIIFHQRGRELKYA